MVFIDQVTLVAKKAGSWSPLDCNRDNSWQATTLRALHREQTETHPHLPVKKPIYLRWSFSLNDRLKFSHTPRGYGGTSREAGR